jgi:hypothetical protein
MEVENNYNNNSEMECTSDTVASSSSSSSSLTPPTPKAQQKQKLPAAILLSSRRPWLQHSDLKPIFLRMEQILHKRAGGYQAAEDSLIYITAVDCLIHLLLHGEEEVQFPPSMLEYIGLGCVYLHAKMTHEKPLGKDTQRYQFGISDFWMPDKQERMSKKDFALLVCELSKYFEYNDMTLYSVSARHIYVFSGMYHPNICGRCGKYWFPKFAERKTKDVTTHRCDMGHGSLFRLMNDRPEYRPLFFSLSKKEEEEQMTSMIRRYEAILSVTWKVMSQNKKEEKKQKINDETFQALMFFLTTTESIRFETILKQVNESGKLK